MPPPPLVSAQQFNPGDFAEAVQKVVESKKSSTQPLAVPANAQRRRGNAAEHITFRVRPGAQAGRSKRAHGMYSPPTQEEADEVRPALRRCGRISRGGAPYAPSNSYGNDFLLRLYQLFGTTW